MWTVVQPVSTVRGATHPRIWTQAVICVPEGFRGDVKQVSELQDKIENEGQGLRWKQAGKSFIGDVPVHSTDGRSCATGRLHQ